jgi:hypothetical protein
LSLYQYFLLPGSTLRVSGVDDSFRTLLAASSCPDFLRVSVELHFAQNNVHNKSTAIIEINTLLYTFINTRYSTAQLLLSFAIAFLQLMTVGIDYYRQTLLNG